MIGLGSDNKYFGEDCCQQICISHPICASCAFDARGTWRLECCTSPCTSVLDDKYSSVLGGLYLSVVQAPLLLPVTSTCLYLYLSKVSYKPPLVLGDMAEMYTSVSRESANAQPCTFPKLVLAQRPCHMRGEVWSNSGLYTLPSLLHVT